jgi:hypothetical protein
MKTDETIDVRPAVPRPANAARQRPRSAARERRLGSSSPAATIRQYLPAPFAIFAAILLLATTANTASATILGDCDGDEETTIVELQACVNVFLGADLATCPASSSDGEEVTIADVQGCVNCFLDATSPSCPMAFSSATPTHTAPPPTPTATPTPVGVCGDGLISGAETCTSCPQDCVTGPCTVPSPAPTVRFRVNWAPPFGVQASSVAARVAYRGNLVSLPGATGPVPRPTPPANRITSFPTGAIVGANDQNAYIDVSVTRSGSITPGRLFNIDFDRCMNAAAPTVDDFACTVIGCASSSGDIPGCSCEVVTP